MKDGNVIEQGTHDELMEKKGAYHKLISQQVLEDKIRKGEKFDDQEERKMYDKTVVKRLTEVTEDVGSMFGSLV